MTGANARFDAAMATQFAQLALANIARDYPHKLDHVIDGDDDVVAPRVLHPAFHGSFDWHSCVHMHWLLARILRGFPQLPICASIEAVFDRNLVPHALATELEYAARASSAAFERPYGWAWLLKLADELHQHAGSGKRWSAALAPLAELFSARFVDFLLRLAYPIRHGVHSNTAFALALTIDYARRVRDDALETTCVTRARAFFAEDRNLPAQWEPSGADFLSPVLMEAGLMRRVMEREAFVDWLDDALPEFATAHPTSRFAPVCVVDRGDGQLVHLDGLNLSRAWCFYDIAAMLAHDDPRAIVARASADAHLRAGWEGLESDDFAGSHWLASFAVLALDAAC
jgi:hypothetical protein